MADVAPVPFINFGLSQAQQGEANASANLENQQAQGAQIANQQAALQLQGMRIGMGMLYQMPGSGAEQALQTPASDGSGVGGAGAPSPAVTGAGSGAAGGAGGAASSEASGTDPSAPSEQADLGLSIFNPDQLDAKLRQDFAVNPVGTPEEQQAILRAGWISALTRNPAYVQQATRLRDMGVARRTFQAQQIASRFYDNAAAVADGADSGLAFQLLQKTAPDLAASLKAQNPDATPEQLNEIAADTAAHLAAHLHMWSGRGAEQRPDGAWVDSQTKFAIVGVNGSLASPKDFSEMVDKANEPISVKDSNGVEHQIPLWRYAKMQGMPVSSAVDYARQKLMQQQFIAQHQQQVQDLTTAAATSRGLPPPGQPGGPPSVLPPSAQSGAAGAPATGGAPLTPNSPNGVFDLSDAPRAPIGGPAQLGVGQSPDNAALATEYGKQVADSASTAAQNVAAANAEIQGAKNAQIALASGAFTGPLSARAAAWQTLLGNPAFLRAILGNPAATQVLTKALGNDAVTHIINEAQGSQFRLGQTTMQMALHQLAASPEMTPQAITTMTEAIVKNAEYARQKWGPDYSRYLRTPGVDRRADAYSGWYDSKYPNTNLTIDPSTLGTSNGQPARIISAAQYAALPRGARYIDPRGVTRIKR